MRKKIAAVLAAFICLISVSGCAGWERTKKSWSSSLNNGLNREVIVYDAIGNELYRQSGKFDVSYYDGRVLFDDENGNRHSIYFETGTVIINEISP